MRSCACSRPPERRRRTPGAMRKLQFLALVSPLLAVLGCGAGSQAEGFKLIHVDDLTALLDAPSRAVTVLDANGPEVRVREGIIPGAVLLSNYKTYDVEKELPPRKDAPLVFYCANSH